MKALFTAFSRWAGLPLFVCHQAHRLFASAFPNQQALRFSGQWPVQSRILSLPWFAEGIGQPGCPLMEAARAAALSSG